VRLTTFLIVAALAVRLRQSLRAEKKLALSDSLTGLANTRAFFDRLSAEIDRALRYGTIFTLAYLDLDHFKEVNDNYGHAEGDEVLRTVAETMRSTMRAADLSARLGGDEFGILLPETPFGKAEGALAKLRTEVTAAMVQASRPVRISVGAVTFEASVDTADDAMRIADGLMYEAKEAGGDTIRHLLWTGDPGRRPASDARK
jgi:diguanylate cyclase (GGDEF)-like protein